VRALIVDDSRAMRMMLARLMNDQGFDAVQAGDGRQALDVLESGPLPDIALVDWNMPVMDGITFLSHVRKRGEWRPMTILMVTTESEYGQIVRALAAGAHEYLIKPFTADALENKLALLGFMSGAMA
jgi:two-component system chemotaxis response regulator CheY